MCFGGGVGAVCVRIGRENGAGKQARCGGAQLVVGRFGFIQLLCGFSALHGDKAAALADKRQRDLGEHVESGNSAARDYVKLLTQGSTGGSSIPMMSIAHGVDSVMPAIS